MRHSGRVPDEHTAAGDTSQQDVSVTNATQRSRYEITVGDTRAGLAQYLDRNDQRIFFHTEIDESFAGRGLASTLISEALTDTRAEGLRIVAVCPFVAKYLGKHHDFDDITDPVTPDALTAVQASKR